MWSGGVAAKNVVNTVLGAAGTAAYHAAIKGFLNRFIKKQYYRAMVKWSRAAK